MDLEELILETDCSLRWAKEQGLLNTQKALERFLDELIELWEAAINCDRQATISGDLRQTFAADR